MNHKQIAQTIIDTLEANNVSAYIYCEATTSSVYVRFKDARNSSIRIADHEGKSKYRYKWNVRTDKNFRKKYGTGWKKDRGIYRYYCIPDEIPEMISLIIRRAETVKTWPVIYNYQDYKEKRKQIDEFQPDKPDESACIW